MYLLVLLAYMLWIFDNDYMPIYVCSSTACFTNNYGIIMDNTIVDMISGSVCCYAWYIFISFVETAHLRVSAS